MIALNVLFIRTVIFTIAWYLNLILQMLVQLPIYFFLSHENALKVPRRWGRSSDFLQKLLVGTRHEVTGLENISTKGCIVAAKHQSLWEFYGLYCELRDPCFVLKAELMKIPVFGWYVNKVKQIPIVRGDRGVAMRKMLIKAKVAIEEDRQILIFPEGTRKQPGDETDYRYGVTRMYLDLNCPVIPVALNAGLYWPRRKFACYPGTIRAKFLEPIMPGLSGPEFSAELERRIEEACDELYLKALEDDVSPPMSEKVMACIERAKARLSQN